MGKCKSFRRFGAGVAIYLIATPVMMPNSPYISQVYDYSPAPGQFINIVPQLADGDTPAQAAGRELIGKSAGGGLVTLGAFGGYVVFGFDHPVVNVKGEYDLKIYGNAPMSGSSEPGIVSVSVDSNGNGIPDDEWYELAGSDYSLSTTIKGYQITYYRPDSSATPTPDPNSSAVVDMQYIRWTDNHEGSGWLQKNSFHEQSYWPAWREGETSYTLTGTRLASNAVDQSGKGVYYILNPLGWGYVDNVANPADNGFKLDWAVDADGRPISLTHIDFVRVHTGVIQSCGWIGETSTEVSGAEDLHPDAVLDVSTNRELPVDTASGIKILQISPQCLHILSDTQREGMIYSVSGMSESQPIHIDTGVNTIDISSLPAGAYIIRFSWESVKFIKH